MDTQNNRAHSEKETPARGFLSQWFRGSDAKRSLKPKATHPVKLSFTCGIIAAFITSIFLLTLAPRAHGITWSGELLTNPGFESGTTGWNSVGQAMSTGGQCENNCDATPHSGSNVAYWTAPSAITNYAHQTVDLSFYASDIDAGNALIDATGWFISDEIPSQDRFWMQVRFYDGSSNEIVADRYDSGTQEAATWTQYGITSYTIPVGARSVEILFDTWEDTWGGGSADDLSVKVGLYNSTDVRRLDSNWHTGLTGYTAPAGSNRLLVFITGFEDDAADDVTNVTYGLQPMQEAVGYITTAAGYVARCEIWYLIDTNIPGGSNDFVVTYNSGLPPLVAFHAAATFSNVDQAAAILTNQNEDSAAPIDNPIEATVNVVAGGMAIAGAAAGNAATYTWGNGWSKGTEQQDAGNGFTLSTGDHAIAADGTDTASATHGNPNRQVIVVMSLAPATPQYDQDSFRSRNDNGDETTSTWTAAADTNWTQMVDKNFRVRFLVQETAGVAEPDKTFQLEYNLNGGGWNDVTAASSVVKATATANVMNGVDTTQQLGSGIFVTPNAGFDESDGQVGGTSLDFSGGDEVEVEFSLQIVESDVSNGDTIELRVKGLDSYSNTPTVTVTGGGTFSYRKSIEIQEAEVTCTSNMNNFPVMVQLTGADFLEVEDDVDADGFDIIFKAEDDATCGGTGLAPCILDHEIELYDETNDKLVAWVRIPVLDYNDNTTIYLYYGNGAVTEATENPTGVWDSNYIGVWHLKETTGTHYDSTSGNNGTPGGGVIQDAIGQIDGADSFDGNDDYVEIGTTGWTTTNMTFTAWVSLDALEDHSYLFGHTTQPAFADRIQIYTSGTAPTVLGLGLGDTHAKDTGSTLSTGTRYHVALVKDATNYWVYLNESLDMSGTYTGLSNLQTYADIGNTGDAPGRTESWRGMIDEVHICRTVRDLCWIETEHSNQKTSSTLVSVGGEVPSGEAILANHTAGQETDAFGTGSSVTGAELFTFQLSNTTGSTVTVNEVVFQLSSVTGISDTDFANLEIQVDDNGDGTIDGSDTTGAVGGTGTVDGSVTTITFSTPFDISASDTVDYILRGDVSNLVSPDTLTIGLGTSNITLASGTVGGTAPTSVAHIADGTGATLTQAHYRWRNDDNGEGGFDMGDGTDGAISLSADVNMNTTGLGGRTYPDGVAYRVKDISGTNITLGNSSGATLANTNGIAAGDEIFLINMQGSSSDYGDVGNYEFLKVSSVSGGVITVTSAPTKTYDGTGDSYTTQQVFVQRVPNYTDVTTNGYAITSGNWDGGTDHDDSGCTDNQYTGLVVFRSSGTVTVSSGGSINTNGLGYRGGQEHNDSLNCGDHYSYVGEGYIGGYGNEGQNANSEGGGGGRVNPDNTGGGGGGGYGTAGANGTTGQGVGANHGYGGSTYGQLTLATIFFGSGGGTGGMDATDCSRIGAAGGAGGGMIFIIADNIDVSGSISADGANGDNGTGTRSAGGGGGSGGSIKLIANTVDVGDNLVTATYGAGGTGPDGMGNGGNGGSGRIRIEANNITLISTNPTASTSTAPAGTPATWAANQDNKLTGLAIDTKIRLRFMVSNTGGQSSGNVTYQLRVAETDTCASGSYSAVPGTASSGEHWEIVDSSYITDGESTFNIDPGLTDPGGATYKKGELRDDTSNTTGDIDLGIDEFTEIEFAIEATEYATDGGDYCFRLYDTTNNTALGSYAEYAEVQLANGIFSYKKPITIPAANLGSSCSADLDDFPVLISLTDTDLASKAKADGYDIIFRALDDTICDDLAPAPCTLDHEIEEWNSSTGELIAWVRIPKLSYTGPTTIYMYYGNPNVYQPTENPAGVWENNNYVVVQHMDGASYTGLDDSTANSNDVTTEVGDPAYQADGHIGYAVEFDGNDAVEISDPGVGSSLDITAQMTVSAWIRPTAISAWNRIVAKSHTANVSPWTMYGLLFDDASHIREEIASGGAQSGNNGTTVIPTDGSWTFATITYDHTALRVYVNDSAEGTPTNLNTDIDTNDMPLSVARSGFSADYFTGRIDEVRVSSIARDACWIGTEYNNQSDPGDIGYDGFYSVGTEESTPSTAVNLLSFTAKGQGGSVLVEWETAQEIRNVGFNLYRAENADGPFKRLNDKLIPGLTFSVKGKSYSFVDTNATRGTLYYYKLEDIDVSGKRTMHGPISVDWDADGMPD
jgi:type II secretory pathway pseudopilin PulG